jgi:hypothetical protein
MHANILSCHVYFMFQAITAIEEPQQSNGRLLLCVICLCALQTVLIVVLIIMNLKNAKKREVCTEKTSVPAQEAQQTTHHNNGEYQFENDIYGTI